MNAPKRLASAEAAPFAPQPAMPTSPRDDDVERRLGVLERQGCAHTHGCASGCFAVAQIFKRMLKLKLAMPMGDGSSRHMM